MADGDPFAPLPAPAEWMTSTTGPKLAVRRWEPHGGAARAVVVLQHGSGFHSGYFGGLGRALAAAGYEAVAMDMVGHGYSDGPRGPPGAYVERLPYFTADLRKLVAQEKARRAATPVFVLAESMGANVALPLGIQKDPNVAGLIICGGAMKLAPDVAKTVPPSCCFPVIHLLARFLPFVRMPRGADYKESWASAFGDPRWVASTRADPLANAESVFYLRTVSEVLKCMASVGSDMHKVECPLLVMHGEADTRTDPEGARTLYRLARSADKQLKLYPNAVHQLFQDSEANIARAVADVKEWLDRRS